MSKRIKLLFALVLFFTVGLLQSFAAPSQSGYCKNESPEMIIIVCDIYMEYTVASWTPISGTAPYQVTVLNMTAGTLHTQFYTGNTTALLLGLVNGNTYRVLVSRGSQTGSIIIDIIDL